MNTKGCLSAIRSRSQEQSNSLRLGSRFQEIREDFPTPEDINDSPISAPSKCVLDIYPSYRKVIDGTLAVSAVGIETMRRECPHFRNWMQRLEKLQPRA
jgi:Domain of unknown function (DUF4276)